ncbi:MAG: hypothetical protein P4L77_11985 [Sulfuriferula sp.]|nr:hypothetical protein [Sulfuriferula sp.]
MSITQGRWTAKTPFPDLQLFLGADEFRDLAAHATLPSTVATPGLLFATVPNGAASIFVKTISEAMLRSGVYATPQYDQEQYGTAASVPGPTSVANTNGPDGEGVSGASYYQGFPPLAAAAMATLGNVARGPQPKGIQIDSIDVIYQVLADATAVAATMGLTKTVFSNLAAPVVTNLIALAANGLPVIIGAQPQVTNVPVPTPGMIIAADTQLLLNINLTGGTAGTIKFYGAVIKAHYNLS